MHRSAIRSQPVIVARADSELELVSALKALVGRPRNAAIATLGRSDAAEAVLGLRSVAIVRRQTAAVTARLAGGSALTAVLGLTVAFTLNLSSRIIGATFLTLDSTSKE